MRIALDYDGTVTEDPDLWSEFVLRALIGNHDVRIVTFRAFTDASPDLTYFAERHNISIVYTGREAKKPFCRQIGWEPDVWIDDTPDLIVTGSDWSIEEYETWQASLQKSIKEAVQGE